MIKEKLNLKKAIGNGSRIKENRFFMISKPTCQCCCCCYEIEKKTKQGNLNDCFFHESNCNVTICKHSCNNLFSMEKLKPCLKKQTG